MANIDIWPVLAGLGLFLFGLYMLEEALKHLAGRSFKIFLRKHTNNSVKAVLAGTLFTTVLQSSSMAALLVMSFAGAGIIGLKNGIGIILGANLGTTITGWIVALVGFKLNIGEAILPFLALGGLGIIFLKSERLSNFSKLLMGFSFMFLGLDYMKNGFAEVAELFDFSTFADQPGVLFVLIGVVLTASIQSSSAAIMIFLSSLAAGMISLNQSFYLVIGADLGTTITAIIGTLNANSIRKKVGWSQVTFNLFNALIALPLMGVYVYVITSVLGVEDPLIALVVFHSMLNLVGILLLLPFLGQFTKFVDRRFASKEVQLAKFLPLVNPQESESAVAALEKESHAFTIKAVDVCKRLFGQGRAGDFNGAYFRLKEYEAEVVEFYRKLQQIPLAAEEVRRINGYVAATRNATLASKYLKDIKHNLDNLSSAASESFHHLFSDLGQEQQKFYGEHAELLKNLQNTTESDLEQTRNNQASIYEKRISQLYGLYGEGKSREIDQPSMLNMLRGVESSNEALLRTLSNLR